VSHLSIPAVVTAGDRTAARPVYGESKVFLELEGLPLVAHVVRTLQRVPEVSEVWVVGDPGRLEKALGSEALRRELRKPLRVVPQFRNLYENAWQSYRRLLPDAGPEGREPTEADREQRVLYLSGDLPFATPEEISDFVQQAAGRGCDFCLGLVTEESMRGFAPGAAGGPGIRMAYFNLREGRFRQSNLFLVKPGRIGNRHYVEEMYEHRYQRQFGQIVALAWRLLRSEAGGLRLLLYYALMHLASIADRRGWRRCADWIRRALPVARVEATLSRLLRASFRLVVTEVGGCAVDIDNEPDYDAAKARFTEWRAAQAARAAHLRSELEGGTR